MMVAVVELVDKFGDDIEYDLHYLGLDLLDFFRGIHPWGKLFRITSRLPWHSQFRKAVESDVEGAEEWASSLKLEDIDRLMETTREPSLFEWDERRELAADIVDAMNFNTIMMIAVNTKKKSKRPKFKPVPRPKTARQKALAARKRVLEKQEADEIIAQMTGGRSIE